MPIIITERILGLGQLATPKHPEITQTLNGCFLHYYFRTVRRRWDPTQNIRAEPDSFLASFEHSAMTESTLSYLSVTVYLEQV